MRTSRLLSIMSASMLTLVLLACGPARAPYRAATDTSRSAAQQAPTRVTRSQGIPLPHGWTLVTYTAAIPYAYSPKVSELRVSAGCHPGERMVGAGYAATSVFEYNANITASYPADDHTWVATGGTQAGIQLDVYCLHGAQLPTVVIASATAGAVVCPADSVLLAEGFGSSAAAATAPTAYALCAIAGVEAGVRATALVTFDSPHNGYMPVYASVSCPTGQVAFGGGVTGVTHFASGASANFSGWDITGGGQGQGSVYADCVWLL